jgi:hypothetical protein
VIGSQAVLATFDEAVLPAEATLSREADVAFWDDPHNKTSDLVDGALGELSQFDATNGYYAQGVSISTADLPRGWEERMVRLPGQSDDETQIWCPEVHDLAVSKLCAHREKDYAFVGSLIRSGHVDVDTLGERAGMLELPSAEVRAVRRWIEGWRNTA